MYVYVYIYIYVSIYTHIIFAQPPFFSGRELRIVRALPLSPVLAAHGASTPGLKTCLGFRGVQGLGFRVQGFRPFRVQGLGLRAQVPQLWGSKHSPAT